jgi:hypothetical protein
MGVPSIPVGGRRGSGGASRLCARPKRSAKDIITVHEDEVTTDAQLKSMLIYLKGMDDFLRSTVMPRGGGTHVPEVLEGGGLDTQPDIAH